MPPRLEVSFIKQLLDHVVCDGVLAAKEHAHPNDESSENEDAEMNVWSY